MIGPDRMDDHSLVLVVVVGSSACDAFEGVEVAETVTEVSVVAVGSEKTPDRPVQIRVHG